MWLRRARAFGCVCLLFLMSLFPLAAVTSAAPDPSLLAWSDPVNLTAPFVGYPPYYPVPLVTGGNGPAEVVWWSENATARLLHYASIAGPGSPWTVDTIASCPISYNTADRCGGSQIAGAGGRTVVSYYTNATAARILTRGPTDASFQLGAMVDGVTTMVGLLVVAPDRVYMATIATPNYQSMHVEIRLSKDGGYTFGSPVDISLAGKWVNAISLAAGPGGQGDLALQIRLASRKASFQNCADGGGKDFD